jgi:hypothetical protein
MRLFCCPLADYGVRFAQKMFFFSIVGATPARKHYSVEGNFTHLTPRHH